MIVLAVITGIGRHSPETDELMRLPHSGDKFRRIIAWAAADGVLKRKLSSSSHCVAVSFIPRPIANSFSQIRPSIKSIAIKTFFK